jgi:hypothetical protein
LVRGGESCGVEEVRGFKCESVGGEAGQGKAGRRAGLGRVCRL